MPGFNIFAQFAGDTGKLINWTRDHRPDAHTVIDDHTSGYNLSRQLHDASPSTLMVHRQYRQQGENIPDYLNALDFQAPEFIIYNIGNEPGLSGDDLKNTLSYLVAAAHLGASKNKPMCLGNFSTGSWQQSDIDKGFYDEYLTVLSIYHDLHYAGIHEYATALLPFMFNNGRIPFELVQPDRVQSDRWVTPEQFIRDSIANYHIGRYLWLVDRCEKLGIKAPRFLFTEFGWDRNGDIIGHVPQLDAYAEKFVTGVNSYKRYWEKLYPHQTWQQSAAQQIAHLETCYTAHVKGKCLFAWSTL